MKLCRCGNLPVVEMTNGDKLCPLCARAWNKEHPWSPNPDRYKGFEMVHSWREKSAHDRSENGCG